MSGRRAMTGMEQSPRLLHITTVPQSLGFFRGQAAYLSARGFTVYGVSSPGKTSGLFEENEPVSIHSVPMTREFAPVKDVISLIRLFFLIRKLRPDIVHSHTPKAGLLGTVAARLAGVRVVFLSVFGLPQMTMVGIKKAVLNMAIRLACVLADAVWCDSDSMRRYLAESGLSPRDKIVVFGKGSVKGVDALGSFNPEKYGPPVRALIRRQLGIKPQSFVIGFLGRIAKDKGLHELAQAWRAVRDRYPFLELLLVGDFESNDPLLPEDELLFRTDSRVHLPGHRSDVAACLSAMDLFVMPSYREGFCLTNIEAAAMELPVVSTLIPGCVDSVEDKVTGTLVAAHDGQALMGAISSYIDSPDLRRRHGLAGRQRVLQDFRPELIWEEIYQEYCRLFQIRAAGQARGSSSYV